MKAAVLTVTLRDWLLKAGVARSSDRSRTDFCGQDISIER